jgi:hypothetical protein
MVKSIYIMLLLPLVTVAFVSISGQKPEKDIFNPDIDSGSK